MVDSSGSSIPLPAAELVGKRIDERRLFEAQFLFHKFSSEIESTVREQLNQRLATRLSMANQVFAKGEHLEQVGELEKAMAAYGELAEIALDYPSLSQAQQRIEVALKLGSFQRAGAVKPEQEKPIVAEAPHVVAPLPETTLPVSKPLSSIQQKKIPLAIACALLACLILFAGLLFFRSGKDAEVTKEIQPQSIPINQEQVKAVPPPIQPVPQPVVPIELPEIGSSKTVLSVPSEVPAGGDKLVDRKRENKVTIQNNVLVEQRKSATLPLVAPDASDRKKAVKEQDKSRLRISEKIILVQ